MDPKYLPVEEGDITELWSLFDDPEPTDPPAEVPPKGSISAVSQCPKNVKPLTYRFGSVCIQLPTEGHAVSSITWRGSLLTSAYIGGYDVTSTCHASSSAEADVGTQPLPTRLDSRVKEIHPRIEVRGKDVLEIGCGRAMPSFLCGAMGAALCVQSDCHDGALEVLRQFISRSESSQDERDSTTVSVLGNFQQRHHLWQQDQVWNESDSLSGNEEDDSKQLSRLEASERVKHWSLGHRIESIPEMEYNRQFDVIIASECLYFADQEAPLTHVIQRRLKRPHGTAIVVFQPRGGNSFQVR
jgi:predicted nicotinamide N-methyase